MNSKGFTLIELLISVTLLSLMLAVGSFSYVQLVSRWDKDLGNFQVQAKEAQSIYQLNSLLSGIQPYIVKDRYDKPQFFFIGGKSSLLAVSHNGLITSTPEVFRITFFKKGNQIKLVYQSTPLSELSLTSTEQDIEFKHIRTLRDDLDVGEFKYFGWASLMDKAGRSYLAKPRWYSDYSALDRELTPEKIELIIEGIKITTQLDTKPNKWLGHYTDEFGI